MGLRWSWGSALFGAGAATLAVGIGAGRPRDPTFQLVSITLSSFRLNLPLLDVELILTVHVTNPNLAPITYGPSALSIFYDGDLLGSAQLEAGSQAAGSCALVHLAARLNGLQLAHHAAGILADAARREMRLHAAVDIDGEARVLWWSRSFSVHVESHVVVDPFFLDVVHQENSSETHLHLT